MASHRDDTSPTRAKLRQEVHRLHSLVELGQAALLGGGLDHLFASAAATAQAMIEAADGAAVLESLPGDAGELRLRAGAGSLAGDPHVGGVASRHALAARRPVPFGREVVVRAAGRPVDGIAVPIATPDGVFGVLAVAAAAAPSDDDVAFLRAACGVLGAAVARKRTEEALRSSEQRLALAQRIARMGSYDWEIATDTNIWSDELYRIYGTEPQSFNASYERFLSLLHPDDRDKVKAVHEQAYRDCAPYQMEERIVRPDGEVRILASNGEVITDEQGRPVRMVGICVDITEQKRAEDELRRSAERFRALVESAPDALLVVDPDGRIRQANEQAEQLFGYERAELLGMGVDDLLPESLRGAHAQHRARYLRAPRPRPMSSVLDIKAVRKDGTEVFVDVSLGAIQTDEGMVIAAFARDATERRRIEEFTRRLREVEMRRRQALEINDNVVQGLSAVVYALEAGRETLGLEAARRTLASARTMMSDLLTDGMASTLAPGDLVRERPPASVLGDGGDAVPQAEEAAPRAPSRPLAVVVADDSADVRLLLRVALRPAGIDVVAEAADGAEAVRLVAEHRPDAVVVDLAMPVMDGLEAIPEMRQVSPATRIIALSGFDADRMERAALDRGAHAYVEKGTATDRLAVMVRDLCGGEAAPADRVPVAPVDDEPDHLIHELRTPLTVILGLVDALRRQGDALPSPAVSEILDALSRNAGQISRIVEGFDDARRIGAGAMMLRRELVDLARLSREVVADLSHVVRDREVTVDATDAVVVQADAFRVRQILVNLLSNAAKFSPPGSPIRVHARRDGDRAEVAVTDRGPGIPPERAGELFGKFSRLGTRAPGLGLGLFISRGIAEAHGGALVLAGGGPGATFVLRLPVRVPASAGA